MESQELIRPTDRHCWRLVLEPDLTDLLGDPIAVALMAADGVDRQGLDALFDRARGTLRRRPAD